MFELLKRKFQEITCKTNMVKVLPAFKIDEIFNINKYKSKIRKIDINFNDRFDTLPIKKSSNHFKLPYI